MIDEYLLMSSFTKTIVDTNLYYLYEKYDLLVLVLYVDDLILTTNYENLIAWYKKKLARKYDIKDNGLMHYFLGLEVW
jgi:hypothetical protein